MSRRIIPPRTFKDIWKEKNAARPGQPQRKEGIPLIRKGRGGKEFEREWVYETKPHFKRLRQPLIDVFREAEEVRIIIDLGGFRTTDISIERKKKRYLIRARKGDAVYSEEIIFPEDVRMDSIRKTFKNGILEIVLPKRK